MITFALVVGGLTLLVGTTGAALIRRLPTLRAQLVGLGLLAALLPLIAVVLAGVVMFDSEHDLTVLAVAAASATVALAAAIMLGRSILQATNRVRSAASEFAAGELTVRAPVDGPAELAQLAESLNEMADRLAELFDTRRQLVAWASHDLRTPLANMQAMLEAVEDGLAEPQRYLPALHDQVRTLSVLVDDLFELARIDAGLTLEVREASLLGLVDTCFRGVEAEAKARRIQLSTRVHGDNPRVLCAPGMVERVLFNLVTNALRHTPDDGSIAVIVEPEPDNVRVSVEDTGDGLPADALHRIFDRFWRGDPGRARVSGGAGLGLAIARGLVEAQGGEIWAENRREGGARICFTLPTVV